MDNSPNRPVQFLNRYSNRLEKERIYGEKWLHRTYGTLPGRFLLWSFAKRAVFSRFYGWLMDRPSSRKKILPFCRRYAVDTAEFETPIERFSSFNDFFIRKLKESARPRDASDNGFLFPADGRHLGFQNIARIEAIFSKGQRFDLAALLRDEKLAERYREGTVVVSRLSPVDCHRFYFPVSGTPSRVRLLNGFLRSVNPLVLRENIHYLFENRRVLTRLETEEGGTVLMIEVGATCVGSIIQTCVPETRGRKGDEKGYFQFGGSALITLFEKGKIRLAADLRETTENGLELYAHHGDHMGESKTAG